jgi:hypothetical protein
MPSIELLHSCMAIAVCQLLTAKKPAAPAAAAAEYASRVSHLLVPAEDVADGLTAGECLVDLHGGTTRVCKHSVHTLRGDSHSKSCKR